MKTITLGLAVAFVMMSLFTVPVQAASMRCGVHIIQGGGRHSPTSFEVLRKCGEPTERRASTWFYTIKGKNWQLRFNGNGLLLTVTQL